MMLSREEREERFWAKVAKTDACWNWTGCITHGYGRFLWDGRPASSHRVAWALCVGPIPAGLHVLHRCDNRRCVRPDHLFLGTNADNVADMVAKGRTARGQEHGTHRRPESRPKGERNGNARLTAHAVREIRRRCALGESQSSLAFAFGVSETTIHDVLARRRWAHVS